MLTEEKAKGTVPANSNCRDKRVYRERNSPVSKRERKRRRSESFELSQRTSEIAFSISAWELSKKKGRSLPLDLHLLQGYNPYWPLDFAHPLYLCLSLSHLNQSSYPKILKKERSFFESKLLAWFRFSGTFSYFLAFVFLVIFVLML